MLELIRVKVADIFPLEDEYGNKFLSRDYDLPANKEYVSALAASFGPSGEPDEQIKLIRDGDVYRIKAGNSRVMAMRELGTEECWAVVDTDDTVQSVLETVVRTNTKKTYEPIERSRFEQQLLLFGDDRYVSDVSQIGIEDVARMRRGRQIAGEKAETYTLDRLFAIGEFEGDDQAVKTIEAAADSNIAGVVARLRREREQNELREAFKSKAEACHIAISANVYKDSPGAKYIMTCDDPENMMADYMAAAAEHTGVVGYLQTTWMGIQMSFYGVPILDADAERAAAEEKEALDSANAQAKALDGNIKEWIAGKLQSDSDISEELPNLYRIMEEQAKDSYIYEDALGEFPFLEGAPLSKIDFAMMLLQWQTEIACIHRICALGAKAAWQKNEVHLAVECLDAYASDGWVPPEGSEDFIAKIRAIASEDGGE